MTGLPEYTVSVLIPCYNSENTVARAIDSVLQGSLTPKEILIYDDGSTDGSIAVLHDLAAKHDVLRVIEGHGNKGAGHARTTLLQNATGAFVAFLDSDDWWYETKLEKQMQRVAEDNADIVTCHYHIYDEEGDLVGTRAPIRRINRLNMHLSNWLPTSMTVVRSSLIGALEMPLIRRRQDYAYWLTLFKLNEGLKCVVVDEPLGGYLRRKGSLSSGKMENLKTNYRMFRQEIGYNPFVAATLVVMNVAVRLFRR